MSHFVALCTEFVAWSEETANIMSDKDPAPEEVRHTSAFTMIEGQSMDDVLDNTAHQAHDDTESDSSDGDSVGQKRDGSFKSNPVAAGGLRKAMATVSPFHRRLLNTLGAETSTGTPLDTRLGVYRQGLPRAKPTTQAFERVHKGASWPANPPPNAPAAAPQLNACTR